jgi:hypothetical protein
MWEFVKATVKQHIIILQINNYRHGDYATLNVVKGKIHPITSYEGTEGGVQVYLYPFFNLGTRRGWVHLTLHLT